MQNWGILFVKQRLLGHYLNQRLPKSQIAVAKSLHVFAISSKSIAQVG